MTTPYAVIVTLSHFKVRPLGASLLVVVDSKWKSRRLALCGVYLADARLQETDDTTVCLLLWEVEVFSVLVHPTISEPGTAAIMMIIFLCVVRFRITDRIQEMMSGIREVR